MRNAGIRRRVVWLLALVVVALAYQVWSLTGRDAYTGNPVLNIKHELEFGRDSGHGNLLAIQPWMQTADYSSGEAFAAKLDAYFNVAKKKGWLRPNTVVVLPEYLGAWLLCAGGKKSVWQAKTADDAMKWNVLSSAPAFACYAATAPCADWQKYAVFRMSSTKMASIYDDTLSQLALDYHVTIVGGSTILPSPSIVKGKLGIGGGALYNVSPVYGHDGKVLAPLVTKVYLTADEKDFVSPGRVAELPVYDTPAGRLGVLICADSWFPKAYEALRRKGAELIVVPSYIKGNKALDSKWTGYSGQRKPADVPQSAINKISKYEAWQRYAFAGRSGASGARCGVMACLGGDLWDLGCDPLVVSVGKGRAKTRRCTRGAVLANTWIGKTD